VRFIFLLVTGLSLGFTIYFLFPGRNFVSGCLSLRCGDAEWAWALSFVVVCFVGLTFRICICMLDVLWVLDLSVDGGGELHYSFP
jgi:hypothetical protein